MNNDLAMNEIRIAEETLKKIDESKRTLLFALETKNELNRITDAATETPVKLFLDNGTNCGIGLRIDSLFSQEELHDLVMTRAEEKAKAAVDALKVMNGEKVETRPKVETKVETPEPKVETKPKKEPKKETPERTPRVYIDHDLVTDMYFKKGMTVPQIVEKTGYGLSSVYKHVQRVQKARLEAAKERARQSK